LRAVGGGGEEVGGSSSNWQPNETAAGGGKENPPRAAKEAWEGEESAARGRAGQAEADDLYCRSAPWPHSLPQPHLLFLSLSLTCVVCVCGGGCRRGPAGRPRDGRPPERLDGRAAESGVWSTKRPPLTEPRCFSFLPSLRWNLSLIQSVLPARPTPQPNRTTARSSGLFTCPPSLFRPCPCCCHCQGRCSLLYSFQ
jgi:hypothetical protein